MKPQKTEISTVCANLARIRTKHRQSQKEISLLLGVSQSTYHRMEMGIVQISIDRLSVLARHYRVMVDDFCNETSSFDGYIYELQDKILVLEDKLSKINMLNKLYVRTIHTLEKRLQDGEDALPAPEPTA